MGLLNAPKEQELIIYVIDPEARYETKNYKTIFPPTNVQIDFAAKERMGEFYNALYDIILQKHPQAFLSEFAWSADGCGQPCATEPLMISELLSLGADVFEKSVPEAERHPKPPELTKEQEKAFKDSIKDLKPKEKKDRTKVFKDERVTVAERQALVARHKYVVSRLHYRYDAKNLPSDPQLGVATAASGGTAQPKGKDGDASTEIKLGDGNKLQIRYNNFHPWVPVIECRDPDRYKWGKAGRDVHILRKTWIAEDLTRKSHTQIKPELVVKTLIPDLGLGTPAKPAKADGSAGAGGGAAAAPVAKSRCSIRVAAGQGEGRASALLALALFFAFQARGRRRRLAWR